MDLGLQKDCDDKQTLFFYLSILAAVGHVAKLLKPLASNLRVPGLAETFCVAVINVREGRQGNGVSLLTNAQS